MTLTIQYVADHFKKLNSLYFNNELPTPKFSLNNARTTFGMFCAYRPNNGKTGREIGAKYGLPYGELKMSRVLNYDRAERDVVNTILHEMVHLWQYWNDLPDLGHGESFKRKAAELNAKGWGIQRICGSCSEGTWASYNLAKIDPLNTDVAPKVTEVKVDLPAFRRKVSALKRSIAILEAKPELSTYDYEKLQARKAELQNLVTSGK